MKSKILVASFLTVSTIVFSQKKELKEAEKLVVAEKYEEAKKTLGALEGQADTMDSKLQPQYYYVNAKALAGKDGSAKMEDLEASVASYEKVISLGTSKYKELAEQGLQGLSNTLVNSAIADQNGKAFKKASEKLYLSYRMRKTDTSYLYYAASNSVNAKDYDTALKYYSELKKMNYDGAEKEFLAFNKETKKEESFPEKSQRDLFVKTGGYEKPSERTSPSKRADITRMIALIYVEQGKDEEAIKAIEDAKKANPKDASLLQTEANLYYKLGNVQKYKEIMEQIVANDPSNPDLYYNLGVSAAQLGDVDKAVEYYKKAIELKSDYTTAKINLSSVMLANDSKIVEEMNSLGSSSADNKRFDELKKKRFNAYKSAVPFLESALEDSPNDIDVVRTLMQIYSQLDDPKSSEMKAKLQALEGGQ